MSVISLNRRFVEWDDKELPDPEIRRAFGLEEGGVGWDELILKRRVVILAEAGSGKSTEMAERARITAASQRYSFHATVEEVGQDGLEQALSVSGRESLKAWRASNEEAWFFIDSVDEAKSSGIRLEKVVRTLADGIHGAEQRAHIVLSGRITDWEFRKDLESLKKWLPVTSEISRPEATAEEELLRIIRQERRPDDTPPPPELPFVARMAPLDHDRVRLFAQGKSVPDLDRFLEAVESANLWHFARRPLDLDWLVRFWQSEYRLGSLAEMVERSITERLKETNTDRARGDTLDSAAALHAVERISAAMVFGRHATIAIPDGEIAFTSDSPLDLADVLPDWSAEDRLILLSRPIFDPATLGRARFHNDNEGVVRGFLTARWLLRLRSANLSTRALFDLLFARSYGLEVIRPSLTETVAWLSLWDKDVANEVVRRGPLLLFGSGDPASLSPDVRRDALVALIREVTAGDQELPWSWDLDKLRRFAQPDLGSVVASLWPQYRTNKEAAQLLLRIVWLGALKDCAKLAYDAAFDTGLDSTARIFAGRALLVTADDAARKSYAELVMAEKSTLPIRMVREAIVDLFPTLIGVPELLEILEATNDSSEDSGVGFDMEGPRLIERLNAPSDLENLLRGLLAQVGGELGEHAHYPPSKREKAYFPTMAAAALSLLQASPPDSVPEVAVDAILRICNRRDRSKRDRANVNSALKELHRTSERRRTAFWRVAHNLRSSSRAREKIDQLPQMEMLGYPAGLQVEDVGWLLVDGLAMGESDCRLAVNAALTIWRSAGEPPGMLKTISSAASSDAVASEVYCKLTGPRELSPEHLEMQRKLDEIESGNAAELAERDQSWIDFIRELRNDPERIAKLTDPAPSGLNSDLLGLWQLLDLASGQSRYAIESVAPLERIAGAEVAEAARAGLIAHWRNSPPLLRSQRPEERNRVRGVDIIGLTGLTLEAASVSGWPDRLSSIEATGAAGYATLELNGFPRWMSELVTARPAEVREVLLAEILDEITGTEPVHRDTLDNVAHGDGEIVELLAPALLDDLETRAPLPLGALSRVLQIIVRGIPQEQAPRFIKLGVERFETEADIATAVQYLAAVFSVDPKAATKVLVARVGLLNADEQAALVDRFLSASFGDSILGSASKTTEVPAETLDELVRLTFQTRSPVAGRMRPAGVAYRVDENDHADHARNAVFSRFVETPGAVTYQALLRLQSDPNCPISSARMRALAEERAIQDSESASWVPSDALAFEQHHDTAPRTAKDLRSVLVSRLEDMQHELLHGDFAQGLTLKSCPKEVDVQNWVADRLRLKQGRAYSVEREPHVIDEKEPDIRIRAKATDASVAMEIKVAESWSLKQLHDALEVQLCGRYLLASDGRYGVLLLVHQHARPKGWEDTTTGTYLSFAEVVARLFARAAVIAGTDHDSPQPDVVVLDVSSC